jgi:enoyl-CoA hydratase/carnithine racemase
MIDGEVIDLGSPCLHATYSGHALRVRIDRVERRNSMTQDMYRGVKRAAILADREVDIDVLVITGTDDVFCVGGDMAGNAIDDPTLAAEWDPTDHFPFRHLERCSAAVIAAVNGLCYAGGLDLMLHCDFSIAAASARFRAPELLRGAPDVFMATRIADWVGVGNARWIMFAMEAFGAERAMQMGLVQQVVPDEAFADAVDRLVASVLQGAPKSRSVIKDDINRGLRQHDARVFQRSIMNPEMREGMGAFVEKRDPVWPRD